MHSLLLALLLTWQPLTNDDAGPLVHALWVVQATAAGDVVSPARDRQVKAILYNALAGDGTLQFDEVRQLVNPTDFEQLAGKSGSMNNRQLKAAAAAVAPELRQRMAEPIVQHLDYLTTTFDMVEEDQAAGAQQLARWIAKKYAKDGELHVIMICTGNSRRSMLGSCMGNAAASYYGLANVRFHSGGTAPSAFNSRTVRTLKEIGMQIVPTGNEAPRGDAQTANPIYQVTWGQGLESTEFSKLYSDSVNPRQGFAALMVCSEADAECPSVSGADLRVSMPYLDPKIYDGSSFEKAKYAERRDDIGRTLLMALCQAKRLMAMPSP